MRLHIKQRTYIHTYTRTYIANHHTSHMIPQLYANPNKEPMRALQRERCYNLAIQIVLFLALVGTSVGFGVYADQNRKARTCPLIYDKANSVVTEAHMKAWVADTGWTLTSPTWSDEVGSCTCDADLDPTFASYEAKTPVWIAPCDLRSLLPAMEGKWPADFVKIIDNGGGCLPTDHVKVCLRRGDLERLWAGDPATTNGVKHCHSEGPPLRVFTGWDGDLYCAKNGCANGFTRRPPNFCVQTIDDPDLNDPPTGYCAAGYIESDVKVGEALPCHIRAATGASQCTFSARCNQETKGLKNDALQGRDYVLCGNSAPAYIRCDPPSDSCTKKWCTKLPATSPCMWAEQCSSYRTMGDAACKFGSSGTHKSRTCA